MLKGSKSLTTLTAKGFTVYSPDSTMWDGKYLALGDQQIGGGLQSGIIEATLSGSTLTSHGQVVLSDTCQGDYTHVIQPFIVGRKNTPINDKQGTAIAGGNEFCQRRLSFVELSGRWCSRQVIHIPIGRSIRQHRQLRLESAVTPA